MAMKVVVLLTLALGAPSLRLRTHTEDLIPEGSDADSLNTPHNPPLGRGAASSKPGSLWLNYERKVKPEFSKQFTVPQLVCTNATSSETLGRACQELYRGLVGMLPEPPEIAIRVTKPGAIFLRMEMHEAPWPPKPRAEGYTIKRDTCELNLGGFPCLMVVGRSGPGALSGVFKLLQMIQREQQELLDNELMYETQPRTPLRMWNMWDNRDRTVARGYSGGSVFDMAALPLMYDRYEDYARILASTGINAVVWNNVKGCAHGNHAYLKDENIKNMRPLVKLFMEYGMRSFMSPCYKAPMQEKGLANIDPRNSQVHAFWQEKALTFKKHWPHESFAGFLVHPDTEGVPCSEVSGTTELQGANAMGKALSKAGAIVIWRALGGDASGHWDLKDKKVSDRDEQALAQYNRYKSWDGKTEPNVVLQIKSGPFGFQAREPVHSLFAMKNINLMVEMQATQEYLGQAKHVAHLPQQWRTYLDFDLRRSGLQWTLADAVTSKPFSGIAAVSNLGAHQSWVGHPFSAANTYGFGRLAWDPKLSAEDVTQEWVEATFGANENVSKPLVQLLLGSWENYEKYTAPLGMGLVTSERVEYDEKTQTPLLQHYHLDLESAHKACKADPNTVGCDRSKGYANTYDEEVAPKFSNLETCPEELLLAFHNVPFDHRLKTKNNARVIDYILRSYREAALETYSYVNTWNSITKRGLVDCVDCVESTGMGPGPYWGLVDCVESTGMTCTEITDKLRDGAHEAVAFAAEGKKHFMEAAKDFFTDKEKEVIEFEFGQNYLKPPQQ